jgi:hypothetical protein
LFDCAPPDALSVALLAVCLNVVAARTVWRQLLQPQTFQHTKLVRRIPVLLITRWAENVELLELKRVCTEPAPVVLERPIRVYTPVEL